ncbi:unnamed protein product, partial [Iphiclides podalirius]
MPGGEPKRAEAVGGPRRRAVAKATTRRRRSVCRSAHVARLCARPYAPAAGATAAPGSSPDWHTLDVYVTPLYRRALFCMLWLRCDVTTPEERTRRAPHSAHTRTLAYTRVHTRTHAHAHTPTDAHAHPAPPPPNTRPTYRTLRTALRRDLKRNFTGRPFFRANLRL